MVFTRSGLINPYLLLIVSALCQEMAAGQNMVAFGVGEVILAVSPMAGKGTLDDPIRPAIVAQLKQAIGAKPIQYRWIPSDDKKLAVVEIRVLEGSAEVVAEGRRIAASMPQASYFERGSKSRTEVLEEIRKVRKDFTFEHFATATGPRYAVPVQGVRP
jgi:hypothetical protein